MPEGVKETGGRFRGYVDMNASFLCEVVGPIDSRRLITLQARVVEVVTSKVKDLSALGTVIERAEVCLITRGLQSVIGKYHKGDRFLPDIKSFLPYRGKGEIRVRLINVECSRKDENRAE